MGLSCLTDPTAPVVIDASTVINLNATACGSRILKAIPNPIFITDVVQGELLEDSRSGRNDGQMVAELISSGVVYLAKLGDLTGTHVEELVLGRGETTLDDGEAATIAYGVEKRAVALIDERKATRLCGQHYPELLVGTTFDVLAHEEVVKAIGQKCLSDALHKALMSARMRVPPQCMTWVVDMIGAHCAMACESIPRSIREKLIVNVRS